MHLVFDIFQGLGVAAAIGVRPFFPALVTSVLAGADIELTFHHTKVHFLQQPAFLIVMVVAIVLLALVERRMSGLKGKLAERPLTVVLGLCALALGALFCGGAFGRYHHGHHHLLWVGVVVGVVCAAIGVAATRPLLSRVRGRLDDEAGGVLPFLTDGVAALAAALSVVAPPVGLIVVLALLWLLIAGRGRSDRKYAGLRILR
ncbi:MAG TPA: DUF4126 family protein [Solirubrobacteraceae bacterium]|nr:DUF4126 family protein [Solirubrobacteraceae bacterium]